jgi:hypothetical protein
MRETVTYDVNDESVIPEKYWVRTLSNQAILADLRAGVEIPGITKRVEKGVAAGRA